MFVATNYLWSGSARAFLRLGFVALFLSFTSVGDLPRAEAASTRVEQGGTPPNAEADTHERRVTKRIRPGDRLPRLLADLRVPRAARDRWLRAVGERVDVANVLGEGDTAVFFFVSEWGAPGPGRMTAFRVERAGAKPRTWQLDRGRIVYHRDAELRPVTAAAWQAPRGDGSAPPAAAPEAAAKTSTKPAPRPSAEAASPVERVTHVIRRGETLTRVLRGKGILRTEAHRWTQAVGKRYSLRRLYPGRKVVLYLASEPGRPRTLRALQIESRERDLLTWQVADDEIAYRGKNRRVVESEIASAPPAAADVSTKPAAGPSAEAAPAVERVTHVIRKGETFTRVLRGKGIPRAEANRWIRAVGKRYPLERLYPGRKVVLYFASEAGGGRTLRALQVESRGRDLLTWQAAGDEIAYRGKNQRVAESEVAAAPPAPVKAPAAAGEPARVRGPEPPAPSVEPLRKVVKTIARGQTLGRIFKSLGVSGKERSAWSNAIGKQYPVTRLKPGQRLHLYFAQASASPPGGGLKAVELEVRKGRKLTWERVGKGIRFGTGRVLGRGRSAVTASPSDGPPSGARKGGLLSEYALAWIKQRNGLLAYAPQPDRNGGGTRPALALDDAERVTHKLKSGEHLWGVLRRYVLDDGERRLWLTAVQQHKQVRKLGTGSRIHMYFEAPANGNGNGAAGSKGAGRIQALEVALRSNLRLTWYRGEQGILFYRDEVPYRQEVKSVSGRIAEGSGSLYASAKRAGVDVGVISRIVDILGWDIDFRRDLRSGDAYRVLYRRKFRPGNAGSVEVHVLAVEFVNRGRKHTAVYFEGADGAGHYYDARGRSVSRSFLRYPLEFRRISSRFSKSRFHPVLKVRRPHLGVDFAARTGTPVRSVGDGRVTHAKWKGGYGRMVEVTHGTAMKTRYAHLRRYGPGIRRGVSVKKGQTIGYVGCSGLCTGPHLHFEMWQNDRYIDPLRAKIPVEHELDPLLMEIFEDTRDLFFARLTSDPKTASLFPQDPNDGAD